LLEKILDFAPVEKKTTGAVSLEQVLLLEKIFNFAPVEKKTTEQFHWSRYCCQKKY